MSRLNQWVAWTYFVLSIVSLLLQLGIIRHAPWGAAIVGFVVQCIWCKGVWHYARQTPCWSAYSWRMVVLVQLVGLAVLTMVLWPLSIKYALLALLVQLPLPLMLWRYSDEEQPYWFSLLQHQQGALLDALLQRYGELRYQHQRDSVQATVQITHSSQGYQVHMKRQQRSLVEQFDQRYHTAAATAAYLEAYALMHVTDLLATYPLETDSAPSH